MDTLYILFGVFIVFWTLTFLVLVDEMQVVSSELVLFNDIRGKAFFKSCPGRLHGLLCRKPTATIRRRTTDKARGEMCW